MSDINAINSTLANISDSLKAHADRAVKDQELNASVRAKVDELLMAQGALQADLKAAQQRIAEVEGNGAGGDVQHISIGQQFVNSDSFKAMAESGGQRGRAEINIKAAITSLSTNADGSAGATVQTTRLPGILELPQRRMTIRSLLAQGTMEGNTLEYVRETGFTNAAAPVAEGAQKPESSLRFDLVQTSAKVIAHWMKASRQILSDSAQLQSFINARLLRGLEVVEENQLLNGNGTGQNLLGLLPQATAFAAPITVANATAVDRLRLALLQAQLAEFPATGIVLNPADWAGIELLKDTQGRYILGNPQGTLAPTLWGLPVVATQAMAVGQFLTGAFDAGAQVFDRWAARVEVATENQDDFIKNMVTILAEERLALAVYRPESFIKGSLAAAAGT
ncbi:major head protein [Xanthomonas phage CP1]|uniref:Head protein n=1 Tax=Xanthomonas phage CP1 TaxID=2994055 RepID=I7HDH9_9CAUD|nr:major head protein [Xanthomonas phage CP1]BAM29080.1 putative head protein [Xanthomonas phage CP1]